MIKGHWFDKLTFVLFILGMISIFISPPLTMMFFALPAGRGGRMAYEELKNANS